MKVFNVYRGFTEFGGAETVLLSIHKELKKRGYECKISGPNPFNKNHPNYNIAKDEYVELSLKNLYKLKDSVVLSHHRKVTTYLYLVKKFLRIPFRLIHISHNEFFNLRKVTLMPDEIIAVSERVKENLTSFFKVDSNFVKVIYNGLEDLATEKYSHANNATNAEKIKILYPGRITKVKRQLEVVEQLQGKLNANIEIHFAGVGEEYESLKNRVENSASFKALGFVSIGETLPSYDYLMLFSSNEGLPLTLIEGCMFGKPLICNDIGGNMEILEDGFNGVAADSYEDLVRVLNQLPLPPTDAYIQMSKNSRKVYEEKFRKDRMIDEYEDVINHPF